MFPPFATCLAASNANSFSSPDTKRSNVSFESDGSMTSFLKSLTGCFAAPGREVPATTAAVTPLGATFAGAGAGSIAAAVVLMCPTSSRDISAPV